ncbi:MAG: desulfoferrodoxin FeS4 iron-binding domain-containing protein [Patescibacteria group bacterium]|nr:desulfoferrodoxin FeS4 iron-binding domain-containing protein [Patescibacteria group bacterium]
MTQLNQIYKCNICGNIVQVVHAGANLVVAGMAEKSGYKIFFKDFAVIGFSTIMLSIAIAQIYIFVRYFIF